MLVINGYHLRASQIDAIETILVLASGNLGEPGLASWIEKNGEKIKLVIKKQRRLIAKKRKTKSP